MPKPNPESRVHPDPIIGPLTWTRGLCRQTHAWPWTSADAVHCLKTGPMCWCRWVSSSWGLVRCEGEETESKAEMDSSQIWQCYKCAGKCWQNRKYDISVARLSGCKKYMRENTTRLAVIPYECTIMYTENVWFKVDCHTCTHPRPKTHSSAKPNTPHAQKAHTYDHVRPLRWRRCL